MILSRQSEGWDIKLIRKIRSSLFAKVFFITIILLCSMSVLVYGLLAWLMPRTYSNSLNQDLERRVRSFVSELEHTGRKDSGGLFDQFIENEEISEVELYGEDGAKMPLPSRQRPEPGCEYAVAEYAGEETEEARILSDSYYFSFADSDSRYMIRVYGAAGQIGELQLSFQRLLPGVFLMIFLAAFLFSWIYSYMITRPVLKISRISQEMSELKLEWNLDSRRLDELGDLEHSLHFLSRKLASSIADLQQANEKLSEDIEHEKELERARLDFFSAVSHELKTPITIIRGQLEGMLLGVGVYKDREKYLSRALEITNTLEVMVQELLTVSRLETSDRTTGISEFDCVPVIQNYLADNEDLTVKKELQIHCSFPETVFIQGNKMLMEKVFSNLLGNAVKYAPTGGTINISVGRQQDFYVFSVENSGDHIPEEVFPKLFEAFYRMEQSRNRKTGGSGLGLYLVQRILERHGSECSVCNTELGVCFSFSITHKSQTNHKEIPKSSDMIGDTERIGDVL